MMSRLLAFVVLVVCTLFSVHARADPDLRIGRMSPLRVDGAPELLRHEFNAVCTKADEVRCAIEARWTLPASDTSRTAVVYVVEPHGTNITVNGEPLPATIELSEAGWIRYSLARFHVVLPPSTDPQVLALSTDIGTAHTVRKCGNEFFLPLAEARHTLHIPTYLVMELDSQFGGHANDPPPATFEGEIEFEFEAPHSWNVYGARGHRSCRGRRWVFSRPEANFKGRNRRLIHGPIVGAGVGFPKRRDPHLWLRGGWEVAYLPALTHSLAVESDIERVLVVPATEIGTPTLGILPSLSVGAGAPLRVAPEFRPGVRVSGSINHRFVSVIGGYDHFPRYRGQSVERFGFIGLQFGI